MKLIITTPDFDPRYLSRGHIHCTCTRCGIRAPLAAFGVRKMPDGNYRNQPQCRECRKLAPKEKRREA